MDKKQYTHPAPCPAAHDYRSDMHKVDMHIKGIVHDGYNKNSIQHLGGAASFHDHLTDLHYGHTCAIKKELKRVIDYLYYFADTGHNIYHYLAEDAFMHVEQLQADVTDPLEREHIQHFINDVKEYMSWLKAEKTGTHFEARQPHTLPTSGALNL